MALRLWLSPDLPLSAHESSRCSGNLSILDITYFYHCPITTYAISLNQTFERQVSGMAATRPGRKEWVRIRRSPYPTPATLTFADILAPYPDLTTQVAL